MFANNENPKPRTQNQKDDQISPQIGISAAIYRWLVILSGVSLLIIGTALTPPVPSQVWLGGILVLFVSFQVIFPLRLLNAEQSLVHVILLGGGFLVGPVIAGWAAVIGSLLGFGARHFGAGKPVHESLLYRALSTPVNWREAGFLTSVQLISLSALYLLGWQEGIASAAIPLSLSASAVLTPLLLFTILNSALILIDFFLRHRRLTKNQERELLIFGLLEVLPLPFIMVAVMASPQVAADSLITMGAIATILMGMVYTIGVTRGDLKRRLQELSTLNRISQVLCSSLEMDNLLAELQLRVRQFLGVENFYVALYNREEEQIWYPIAVKRGQIVQWPSRALTDRLTDRVIREQRPIMLPRFAHLELPRIGLPIGEEPPSAWMGVPLVASDKTIGCLAAFSYMPETLFHESDLNLLETLSGQVSLAVENASLFEKARQRQARLETMSHITTLITGSQNPQEVLAQVCQSVVEVNCGEHSAIYLINPDEGEIWLAYAHNMSDDYLHQNQRYDPNSGIRSRCLRSGQPVLVYDLEEAELETQWSGQLKREGIKAYGDFPLVTPEGQIGYLAAYFDTAQPFNPEVIALLKTFAAQVALAVSNARLHARTDVAMARRANQLSILEAIGRELSASIQSEQLFETILKYALELTNSQWGILALYDAGRQILDVKASRGYPEEFITLPVDQGFNGRAVRTGLPVNVPEVKNDPDYVDFTGGEARSHLSIPLTHKGSILGVITLESTQPAVYTPNDQMFIGQLASQAAVAVVNAKLYADIAHGRDHLAAVINSVREGILMVNPHGRILLVNDFIQSLTGMSSVELMEKILSDLPEPVLKTLGCLPGEAVNVVEALEQNRLPDFPRMNNIVLVGGTEHVLERSSSVVRGQDGQTIGWMIILRDRTDEYRIEQERELLTETLVHDLRSPISTVIGALEVIEEVCDGEREKDIGVTIQAANVAKRSAQRVLNLVESVLDIAHMASGKVEQTLVWLDVRSLAANVVAEYAAQAQEYGLTLIDQVKEECPLVYADKNKINRVLANLVDNALKFTPADGKVVVSAAPISGGFVEVRVSDTGHGIPEEFRDKIFERFYQIPGRMGRRRGSGLGLTFCRLAVETHGGKIWMEANPEGGSAFVFSLPVSGNA